ncbi:MAG: adenylate/guanylate cyclase domain-containing protein, partial [Myxococcota bacterium]|nr:adenylate/guanylate cyclase domain-containing protein [Myxococcota bacterium]
LKDEDRTIADGFDLVTVLFADIVGFTALSARVRPDELVAMLNRVFSAFDEAAERHGIEKIKTIGDAYMAAAGLPQAQPEQAEAMAAMALEMQGALKTLNVEMSTDLDIRIGIHSGPVVAGVIGKRKFIYDLWGDTVNVASRMESHGEPGAIQVSGAVHDMLGERWRFEPRGEIQVKGKGPMATYFLLGRAQA